jgi:hypothetical protein
MIFNECVSPELNLLTEEGLQKALDECAEGYDASEG